MSNAGDSGCTPTFEIVKMFVMAFMEPGPCRTMGACSKPCYRASRMPHLLSQALTFGIVNVAVEQVDEDEETRALLLFSFEDDVPHDQGLCAYAGLSSSELEKGIGTRWLPVVNFRVPDNWVAKSVREVQEEEEFSICGLSRIGSAGTSTNEIWFPNPFERFDAGDEVILCMQSAFRFTERHCPHAPPRDPKGALQVRADFPWEYGQGHAVAVPEELGLGFTWNWSANAFEQVSEGEEEDDDDVIPGEEPSTRMPKSEDTKPTIEGRAATKKRGLFGLGSKLWR